MSTALRWAAFVLLSASAFACGGPNQYVLRGQQTAAGADGNLTVGEFEDGNSQVELEVSNLAPPSRIEEDATVYVVWFKPEDGNPTKAGVLAYDADDRTGRLRATTANREFTVVVTAEEDADASEPSDHVVFQQEAEVP